MKCAIHSFHPAILPAHIPSFRAAERNINAILDPWEFAGVTTARTIRIIGHPTPAEAEIINIITFEKMYANWPKVTFSDKRVRKIDVN